MTEFKREERYIVVKLKHLNDVEVSNLRDYLEDVCIETLECVVVEKNFPIYEDVWTMIAGLEN